MTELERARAHLLSTQQGLYNRRAFGWIGPGEDDVLAALSWVWLEQEREQCMRDMLPMRWASYPWEAPFA